jgi:hypothetical protein
MFLGIDGTPEKSVQLHREALGTRSPLGTKTTNNWEAERAAIRE